MLCDLGLSDLQVLQSPAMQYSLAVKDGFLPRMHLCLTWDQAEGAAMVMWILNSMQRGYTILKDFKYVQAPPSP